MSLIMSRVYNNCTDHRMKMMIVSKIHVTNRLVHCRYITIDMGDYVDIHTCVGLGGLYRTVYHCEFMPTSLRAGQVTKTTVINDDQVFPYGYFYFVDDKEVVKGFMNQENILARTWPIWTARNLGSELDKCRRKIGRLIKKYKYNSARKKYSVSKNTDVVNLHQPLLNKTLIDE